MRQELQSALAKARTLSPEELPALIGELAEINAVAVARLASSLIEKPDQLLDVAEASRRLHISENYLYRHAKRFPFTRHQGRKLLFSSNGLDSHLKKAR